MSSPENDSPVAETTTGADEGTTGFGVFDLDHTVLPFDTQVLFCNHVLRRHFWRRFYLFIFIPLVPFAAIGVLSTKAIKRVFLSYLWGMRVDHLRALAQEFADETVTSVAFPSMVHRIQEFHEKGYATILNTASPEFYAKEIARTFGMTHCYGTQVVVPDQGRMPLFPKIEGPNNKRVAKLKRMEEHFPEPFDEVPRHRLRASHAFSDSEADTPLLHCCEHATLVNPDKIFREEGERRAWKPIWPDKPYKTKFGDMALAIRQALGFYRPVPASEWTRKPNRKKRRRRRH